MKVVLTEKPSVARDIASFLGVNSRHEGYYQGRGYQVVWAFGHLVTLKEPEDYDPALKKWSLDTLPFVPQRFELKLIDDKGARKQFAVIKRLFQSATELICATDAGREGELIFRYILDLTGCQRKPCRRLWLASLTDNAIRDALNKLRPGSDYDNLYAAAKCRSEADWIVGLNATRNFTVRYGSGGLLWSAGRVQTPVLAMIVRRDDEIRVFQPQPFWELLTRYRQTTFKFNGDRFPNEQDAQQLLERAQGHEFVIQKVDTKRERVLPPLLYDLTELQRDMNRRYGMSAADTLKTAQFLYENKAITYPRTDSRFLTRDMKAGIPGILRKLQSTRRDEIGKLNFSQLPFNSRIVNDKKVSEHHAIIPTETLPTSLSPAAKKVYDAIVTRFVAVFYPPCLKDVTTVDGVSNSVAFRAKGVRIVEPGWTELYPRKTSDQKGRNNKDDWQQDDDQELPAFTAGERGPHEPFVRQGETKPPRHYTENTLLSAMETAGKLVDDEQLKEALKEKGLGTPATRAAIIETLLKRNYIARSKKTLEATELGRYLIALIQDRSLKSPELTGQWEAKLRDVQHGDLDPSRFMTEIVQYTGEIIRSADASIDDSKFGDCPRCGRPIIEGRRGYGCSGWRDGCSFVLWKTYKDHQFSIEHIRELLQRGRLVNPQGLGDSREIILSLTQSGALAEIPVPSGRQQQSTSKTVRRRLRKSEKQTSRKTRTTKSSDGLGACPLCGANVVEQKKSFSCSDWRQGCQFVIWKTIAGKRISERTAKTLLNNGHSSVLKGFKSKAGKPFNARLKLDRGKVVFEFD